MKLKFRSFLLEKKHVTAMVKAMKAADLDVRVNKNACTVEAFFNDTSVYQAIEKGRNQPWIVRHAVDLFV
jgi:16S rRNA U1498 N3-methylase RsmE